MKKYLVFTYYVGRPAGGNVGRPLGGMKDFLDSFETVEEALDNILMERNRYYQIVDRETLAIVKEGLAMFKHFAPDRFERHNTASN